MASELTGYSRVASLMTGTALAAYLALAPEPAKAGGASCCDSHQCTAHSQCFDAGYCVEGTSNMCVVNGSACYWIQASDPCS